MYFGLIDMAGMTKGGSSKGTKTGSKGSKASKGSKGSKGGMKK
jgi:hypothetical protein